MAYLVDVKGVVIAIPALSPTQCRMARAALSWTLDDLAVGAGVNRKTILRFERGEADTRPATTEALREAFESAGVRFAEKGGVFPPG